MDNYSERLDVVHQELNLALTVMQRVITEYSTPIAGCDEQFNHSLSQHERVLNALAAFEIPHFVPTPRRPDTGQGIEKR